MKLFSLFKKNLKKPGKHLKPQTIPTKTSLSIYEHICKYISNNGILSKDGDRLPDDERRYGTGNIRWVSGGLDGTFGHHSSGDENEEISEKVVSHIQQVAKYNSEKAKQELYAIFKNDQLMDFIDEAIEKMVGRQIPIKPYLNEYARWLATKAHDRGAVKMGIALLGLIGDRKDKDVIITLGKHEEFTLFTSVALTNMIEEPETELWQLAQYVNGWGKIHIIERLCNTQNPEIKKWLVRHGYQNDIMNEYLAYKCAVAGNLLHELENTQGDVLLLNAAGDIITALLNFDGPAEDIYTYDDAAFVVRYYVTLIQRYTQLTLTNFLHLHNIKEFLEDDGNNWKELRKQGWTEDHRSNLLIDIHQIVSGPEWKDVLALEEEEGNTPFLELLRAGTILGVDIWKAFYKRLLACDAGDSYWYHVESYINKDRVDSIVKIAIAKFPLNELGAGPAEENILGTNFSINNTFNQLLLCLKDYPSHGEELIVTALKSPVTLLRKTALEVLQAHGKNNWSRKTRSALQKALKLEPDNETRIFLEEILK